MQLSNRVMSHAQFPEAGPGREHEDPHTPIVRSGCAQRLVLKEGRRRCPGLSEPSDPHLSAIERKIQEANEYPCNRQHSGGDVGIDQFVQVMEQKATLVRLDQPWLRTSSQDQLRDMAREAVPSEFPRQVKRYAANEVRGENVSVKHQTLPTK